jgi:protein phosphatase
VGSLTDIGLNPNRTKNEDSFGYFTGEYGHLLIVCDGMGGYNGGELAAQMAVESIHNYFETYYIAGEETITIEKSIRNANQRVLEYSATNPALNNMGTTLVLLLIRDNQYWYAHVGDSRLYLRREGMFQLTKDHSAVQELVDMGAITQEEAKNHPSRHIVNRVLGHESCVPEINGPQLLYRDDVFLLCTDGLTNHLSDEDIYEHMLEEPQIACINLVEEAKKRGGSDNITVQLIHVLHGPTYQAAPVAEISNKQPVNYKKYAIYALIFIVSAYILIMVPKMIGKMKDKKPAPVENVVGTTKLDKAAEKAAKKAAKAAEKERKKQEKLAKKQGKSKVAPQQQVVDYSAQLEQYLKPTAAGEVYSKFLSALRSANPNAKLPQTVKFIPTQPDGKVVFVDPGKTVYVAYNDLANNKKVNEEQIKHLMLLAMAQAETPPGGSFDALFRSTATGTVSEATKTRAKALFVTLPKNTDYDFGRILKTLKKPVSTAGLTISY